MAKITYKGIADVRTLTDNDLKAHGLEGFETIDFRRHQPTEVSDEAAELILSKPRLFGRFVKIDEAALEELEAKRTAEAEGAVDEADSTSQLGVDSPAGSTAAATTGGSSTSGTSRRSSKG